MTIYFDSSVLSDRQMSATYFIVTPKVVVSVSIEEKICTTSSKVN